MKSLLRLSILLLISFSARAGRISGRITDEKGIVLPYASVLVKGTTNGTTANADGRYFLDLDPGTYTIVAQYVGYNRQEKTVTISAKTETLDFVLQLQQTAMKEVVVRPGGEDPAYEIIRNAIKKRKDYLDPLDSFTCEAYIKTLIKTRKLPKKVFGQKIDQSDRKQMGVDSAGQGIIFLSESLTRVAYKKPEKLKLEVLSGRQSGSNGFGFNFPTFINFYQNNVNVFASQLNPRGFVSPIADGALNYYRYRFIGSFWEDGKEINQIKVIPRRKYEPLFSGTIYITEGDWRIHSLELLLTKESQLEILDSIRIRQLQFPVNGTVWEPKDQVVYFTFNQFGIDAVGNFLNVYNKYELRPQFNRKFFNNVVIRYDTAVNKHSKDYWDSIRPVALEPEEARDYRIKDSSFKATLDSSFSRRSRDSLLKRQGPVTVKQLFWSGFSRSNFSVTQPWRFTWEPIIKNLQYNTVEGLVVNVSGSLIRSYPRNRTTISFTPHLRYGFSNNHFNGWTELNYSKRSFSYDDNGGTAGRSSYTLLGGTRVSQFNKAEPITPLMNAVYTLFLHQNYMKLYENRFGEFRFAHRYDNGLRMNLGLLYEDRLPLENTTDYSFAKSNKVFSPNFPTEQLSRQFARHQALILNAELEFRPGQQYIQYPRNKVPLGSKYPLLNASVSIGLPGVLGSDVDFGRWQFNVSDDVNLKLKGLLKYRFRIGGFFRTDSVAIQDYQHFNGNQTLIANQYLNGFQVAPYYANSTKAAFFLSGHLEHHFNGLLTNKIPLFRRLNWNLVGGANGFLVNRNNNYAELFVGLENIFKVIRVDFYGAYLNGKSGQTGIRIGFGGLLGGNMRIGR